MMELQCITFFYLNLRHLANLENCASYNSYMIQEYFLNFKFIRKILLKMMFVIVILFFVEMVYHI